MSDGLPAAVWNGSLLRNRPLTLNTFYTDLGEQTYFRNVLGGFNGDLQFHTIRAGVNYRFGYGG